MNTSLTVDQHYNAMQSLSTEELSQRLKAAFQITADKMREIAAAVRILEERGEDLEVLKLGIAEWYRKIAYGQVLPEIFERYRHRTNLLNVIAFLPLPDQERLSQPCSLPVLTTANGDVSERMVDPLDMTDADIRQVFGKGRLRNLAEQRGWIEGRTRKNRSSVEIESGVVIEKKKKAIVINGVRFSRSQLLSYLSQLDD